MTAAEARAAAHESVLRDELAVNGKRVEFATIALCAIGLVMVYSATSPYNDHARTAGIAATFGTLYLQAGKLGLALLAYLLGRHLGLGLLRRSAGGLLLLAVGLLALVPVIGVTLNGSQRWFMIGPVSFQPVELVKLALVAFLAARLAALGPRIRNLRDLVALVGVAVLPVLALLFRQPDFGSSVFVLGVCLVLVIIAGARFVHYAGGVLLGFTTLYVSALLFFPYVIGRFTKHADTRPGDQVYQALLALGAGGLDGAGGGLGAGVAKLGYVPMIQNDFIFAAIGEETGFIGTSIVVVLFAMLTYAGARIAQLQRDPFRFLLAVGLVTEVAVQALINLAVVTALGPTKGIALPFVSSGGTALLFSLFGAGLIVNLARPDELTKMEAGAPAGYAGAAPRAGRALRERMDRPGARPVPIAAGRGAAKAVANG